MGKQSLGRTVDNMSSYVKKVFWACIMRVPGISDTNQLLHSFGFFLDDREERVRLSGWSVWVPDNIWGEEVFFPSILHFWCEWMHYAVGAIQGHAKTDAFLLAYEQATLNGRQKLRGQLDSLVGQGADGLSDLLAGLPKVTVDSLPTDWIEQLKRVHATPLGFRPFGCQVTYQQMRVIDLHGHFSWDLYHSIFGVPRAVGR